MGKDGYIIRYAAEGNVLQGVDRWDVFTRAEADFIIEHLKLGGGERTFGEGLREGDLIALFSTTNCDPANEIIVRAFKMDETRLSNAMKVLETVFAGEEELLSLEYQNGNWISV